MQAVRQRSARAIRRTLSSTHPLRPASRSYASDHGHDAHHDDHHHAPEVNEAPGWALYISLGAIGASMLFYNLSRPSESGEPSAVSQWIDKIRTDDAPKWQERNTLRTDFLEQAAQDRNLFRTIPHRDFTYRSPELLHSGSPRNVPAGHSVNLDHIVEHFRKLHLDEEERKAKNLAKAKKD